MLEAPDELVLQSMWKQLSEDAPRLAHELSSSASPSRLRRALRSVLDNFSRAYAAHYLAAFGC